jgi:hypothetical protein
VAERTEDDILFEEIDDELRQDQANKLWKAYGHYVIALCVAIVVGVGGLKGWRYYDLTTRQADGERFTAAITLAAANKTEDAYKAFSDIAEDSTKGYKVLARFSQARLMAQKGDANGAADAYRALTDDASLDSLYRDMAVILGALVEMNIAGTDWADLEKRLAPLSAETNHFRFSAREISAIAAQQNGDTKTARDLFTSLSKDAKAPQGVRARAQEMLSILGN